MIRADLKDAGIPDTDEIGRVVDFHSLRHTFSSLLASSGVHPKVAQELMRHGDINLTMSRYTHVLRGQTKEALDAMPDLSPNACQEAKATGTDNQDVTTDGAYKPAYKKLTKNAVSDENHLSLIGNNPDDTEGQGDNSESPFTASEGTEVNCLAPTGTDGITTSDIHKAEEAAAPGAAASTLSLVIRIPLSWDRILIPGTRE
jgi:hypothetical protein